REKLEEARRHHERELDRARKRKDILSRRAVELRQELESLERKREALASEINIRFLRKYEQLRASGKAEAVVGLSNGNCGGCLTVVPPQNALEIRQGILYHCPICGRFIVWSEDSSLARKS
ncbi:hypothetical protein JW921_08900, partial [Candidatus Fermentibacterales bacterium]|nr:hypothetical protein [Candidatus Fermentibacterales bacterium]